MLLSGPFGSGALGQRMVIKVTDTLPVCLVNQYRNRFMIMTSNKIALSVPIVI